jgi:hypothetical protein
MHLSITLYEESSQYLEEEEIVNTRMRDMTSVDTGFVGESSMFIISTSFL